MKVTRLGILAKLALTILGAAVFVGCGSGGNLGSVTGKVTLDGQPLSDAILTFSPVNGGSPSAGKTDSQGNFTLVYSPEESGAEPGQHRVWISTALPADTDADPPRPAVSERVPESYRIGSALQADVKQGRNTVNFELISAGTSLTSSR